ncbi:MAG TPA: hypothetical protein VMG82_07845 [Candidatus Sulfotelmatobacter sp.]|nr:hypothetical protein [Candidatus Sulfotelmatobacter sp.]
MIHASLKLRITTIIALLSFCTLTLATTGAFAQPPQPPHRGTHSISSFVQGNDAAVTGSTTPDVFSGVVTITGFTTSGNQLIANGVLNGTLIKDGTPNSIANEAVSFVVAGIDPNCQLLNLVLAPLDVNLLGLTIHLNQVVLNITAVPGAGNLLGNLLCDVANLLNSGGALSTLLTQLNTLLNQILSAL